jgi:exodeoxyribonuclease V alpha subunit
MTSPATTSNPSATAPSILVGSVERVTYTSAETGYTIARVKVSSDPDPVTIVGHFSSITPGESLRMAGFWVTHKEYGPQFKVVNYEVCKPATLAGIEKYLGSGLIKGVGPVTAKRIVAHFRETTLDVIEKDIERLREVPGIGRKRVEMISRAWIEQQAVKEVMLFLQSHGVSTHFAVKIYKTYGDRSIQTVTENPYRLAKDIYGIGFRTADKIAADIGIASDSDERIRAGLSHALSEATDNGHCYLPGPELIEETAKLLSVENRELLEKAALAMASENELIAVPVEPGMGDENRGMGDRGWGMEEEPPDDFGDDWQPDWKKAKSSNRSAQTAASSIPHPPSPIPQHSAPSTQHSAPSTQHSLFYLPALFQSERNVARFIRGLLTRPLPCDQAAVSTWIGKYTAKAKIELSEEQLKALSTAAGARVMVLTGGPGCGKTTTLRAMVKLFKAMGRTVELASPTGRAAQRLSEVAGVEARTIHRMLAYDPKQHAFTRNAENPLEADVIVVDEASMLDVTLAAHLLKAVPSDGQLVLVGDIDQLPSVGPGRVLSDIIDSEAVPVIRLTQVFRQAQGSFIITNAHRIREGEFPRLIAPDGVSETDCYFLKADEPEDIHRLVVNAVTRSLPKKFGYHPSSDIQVLTPMNRGSAGAGELNRLLQGTLNPPDHRKEEIERMGRVYRVGDKVIQRVNNYNLEVFNGDVGTIIGIDTEDQTATIDYGGREVIYDWADLNEVGHGFAISIHKSQGSEYPAVVMVVHPQAFPVLSRNLIYTGLTRAKRTVVIVGSTRAVGMAMGRTEAGKRYTRLAATLAGAIQ